MITGLLILSCCIIMMILFYALITFMNIKYPYGIKIENRKIVPIKPEE